MNNEQEDARILRNNIDSIPYVQPVVPNPMDVFKVAEGEAVTVTASPPEEPALPSEEVRVEKKSSRINPDSPKVLVFAILMVFVLMISSFIISFFGIWGISAETTNIPGPLTWLPALFLDAAIIAYTISYFVFKARGEAVWRSRLAMWGFAILSVGANIAHTIQGFTDESTMLMMATGVLITGSAPIAVVLAAEEIARLAFEPPKERIKKGA
jgi:hypothetical protein